MTPEESSVFFNLLRGTASDPARRWVDFLADPDAGDWDEGITNTYSVGDYIAYDLQKHARGCNLPIAKCHLCRLCELEIKRRWPDLWLSKWPGAKADETREFTELGKCPEPECGSTDRGTRYQITPPTEGNPLGTYCKNAWHNAPEVQRDDEFTELEFQVIFAMCWGWAPYWRLDKEEIAKQLGLTEGIVHVLMASISEKVGLNLREFARTALNNELRRQRT